MTKKLNQLLAAGALAGLSMFALTGCELTIGGNVDVGYSGAWYNVYGQQCGGGGPSPGCNYFYDGHKASAWEDPYYNGGAAYYWGTYTYYDSYGYRMAYTGYVWTSPSGVMYDSNGYALNSNEGHDGRDLIGDVAQKEEATVTRAGKAFAAKYSLSESTGLNIARTLNDWATLSQKQKRSRTAQDVADFSQRLYGVSVDKALSAIDSAKKGDAAAIEQLNAEVATYWGTTPETSKTILKSWYQKELGELGLR